VYYEDLYPSVAFLPRYCHPDDDTSSKETSVPHETGEILPLWHIQGGRRFAVNPRCAEYVSFLLDTELINLMNNTQAQRYDSNPS